MMKIPRKDKHKDKAIDRRSGNDRRVVDDNIMEGTDQRTSKDRRKKAGKQQPKQ